MGPSIHDSKNLAEMLEAGMVSARVDLTWGPLDFHRNSLRHLEDAMKNTRRLCATVIDTMGRELMVKGQVCQGTLSSSLSILIPLLLPFPSQYQTDEQGYPWVLGKNEVVAGQKIVITCSPDAVADAK